MNSFNHYAYGAIGACSMPWSPHRDRTRRTGLQACRAPAAPGGALTAARAKLAAPRARSPAPGDRPAASTGRLPCPPIHRDRPFAVPAQARVTEGGKPLDRAPGVSRIARTGRGHLRAGFRSLSFSAEWSGQKA